MAVVEGSMRRDMATVSGWGGSSHSVCGEGSSDGKRDLAWIKCVRWAKMEFYKQVARAGLSITITINYTQAYSLGLRALISKKVSDPLRPFF